MTGSANAPGAGAERPWSCTAKSSLSVINLESQRTVRQRINTAPQQRARVVINDDCLESRHLCDFRGGDIPSTKFDISLHALIDAGFRRNRFKSGCSKKCHDTDAKTHVSPITQGSAVLGLIHSILFTDNKTGKCQR